MSLISTKAEDINFFLFQNYGPMKDLIPLLNRFITLLQAYISYDPQRALKYLQKHAQILQYVTRLISFNDFQVLAHTYIQ